MGLDTVELVYSFEQYFGHTIPDPVAERLLSVADVAAWFSEQLGVAGQRQSDARETVGRQLQELLALPPEALASDGLTVQQALPDADAVAWFRQQLAGRYGLVAPELVGGQVGRSAPSFFERLLGVPPLRPGYWPTQPLAALVDWVVAASYATLLPRPPASAYEVERAVVGITSDKSGVPVEEIQLSDRFTHELGMD